MRLNKYLASSTSLSRRGADAAIDVGRVTVDGKTAVKGTEVKSSSQVKLDGRPVYPPSTHTTIALNKPIGYVCSRNGQGSPTVYDLLPSRYHSLQTIGRLDKDSSGILLLSDDGDLAHMLSHPRFAKIKIYEVTLDQPLAPLHQQMICDHGITLDDGKSQFLITRVEPDAMISGINVKSVPHNASAKVAQVIKTSPAYQVQMQEGRNRQIRRTFSALGYTVTTLHRTHFGPYTLGGLPFGQWKKVA
ncbi:rRNA pseudouridine synthase [Candidatus Saccharibacteria bacterium]|nr:rRNA pseudouridine synthase [Candidatus Saccharibacteria bacterium]